jgi:NADPH:quinone reductase-like Zn-dependent oxidoreductase
MNVKAFALEAPDRPADLVTLPPPSVGPRDVLVAIKAASVNGFDVYQARGHLIGVMEHRLPAVVGRDLAGVVEAIGPEVTDLAIGDEVFGFVPSMPPLARGSFADRIVADDLVLVRKPAAIDFRQAASLPLAGSAALDLLEAVEVAADDTVLIVGATGGVGTLAIQLAAGRGATVIATARPEERDFVTDLGAAETIDYTADTVADAVGERYPDGITALIDLVSQGEALTEVGSVVRTGGRVATLLGAADVEQFAARGITAANVNAMPTHDKLERLGAMVASGELRVVIQEVYSLDRIGDAMDAFGRGTRGKLIITMPEA